ncbi:hypothetical protein NBRC116583_02270 [Arenicella sp. 4NH20-0111]|uniref:hypothetical protein n=1 Tax=Arenicella sp. 4NH20-0111 TaxID=3127648 RepID=UPI0031076DED
MPSEGNSSISVTTIANDATVTKTWQIDMAGVHISVTAAGEPSVQLVDVALSAIESHGENIRPSIELLVTQNGPNWLLVDQQVQQQWTLTKAGDLIYHLTDRIVFHIADKASGVHCVHAAAVAKNGRAMVIPANSGAGKSSFTTWLVSQGFDYLSDELVLIDDSYQLTGLSRPIQIKKSGVDAINGLVTSKESFLRGDFASALAISGLGGAVCEPRPQKLSLMVFPHYVSGADFSFKALSSAEAGMAIMENHVNARSLDGHGFSAMMALVKGTPCYALEYGGFDTLPHDFSTQLSSLL